jgi:pyruvate/2-oxoglutarate dehydrogenase complex dihydrolipoamide dehydrogenase (E3) component/uncharacterized membrane protein YdjX (TVP38/TMEM64 family)
MTVASDAALAEGQQAKETSAAPACRTCGPGAKPGRARGPRPVGKARILLAVAALAAVVILLATVPVQRHLLDLVGWIRGAGFAGALVFVLAYVLATVSFLPGSILTLGAGFAYGVGLGTAVVTVGANLGAALAFVLGRTVARRAIAARVEANPRFAAIDRAVGREGLKIVLLTRLSPVFPFNLLNYAFGLTNVSLRHYVLGSLIGMLPGTLMYVYLGSLITSVSELAAGRTSGGFAQQIFYFAGLAATVAVTLYVTRIARRALADATARESEGAAPERNPGVPGRAESHRDVSEPATAEPRLRTAERSQDEPLVLPDDAHNRALTAHVHPPRWLNPVPTGRYNLVVVGGGTAGLVSAAGAAGLGAKVALVEKHLLGGDCLNVGCVPSKALISAARAAASARGAAAFGVRVSGIEVDFPAVMERMRRLRAEIAPHDGAERFAKLGVDVFLGEGSFTGPKTLSVGGQTLEFSRAVIATGARAAAPPIPGIEEIGYFTNETLFSLTELPRRLLVIGAGPIGCEMAQTFRRFGSEVTLFEAETHILPREDADAAAIVERQLRAEGIHLIVCGRIQQAERKDGEVVLHCEVEGARHEIACDAVLLAVGRAPNVEGLGLEAAGVTTDARGVTVNDFLQTSNPRIYAAGDIASQFKFTHTADALARIVLANALFAGRQRASALHVPWCTYTSPEIAHVGLYEDEAAARGLAVDTITVPMADVDRALLDGRSEGFLRVHFEKGSDRILGATLVAEHAGDMISEITVAMAAKRGLGTIAKAIHPYPTQAEVIKKAADTYNRSRLTPTVQRILKAWLRLRR